MKLRRKRRRTVRPDVADLELDSLTAFEARDVDDGPDPARRTHATIPAFREAHAFDLDRAQRLERRVGRRDGRRQRAEFEQEGREKA